MLVRHLKARNINQKHFLKHSFHRSTDPGRNASHPANFDQIVSLSGPMPGCSVQRGGANKSESVGIGPMQRYQRQPRGASE